MRRALAALLLLAAIAAAPAKAPAEGVQVAAATSGVLVDRVRKLTFTDDFDAMVKRGYIRVLVVFSKTYYFIDKGQQRGLTYEAFSILEQELNKQLKLKKRRLHVVFIPVTRDELIPDLIAGHGDIAAAGLTITPGRQKQVDFTDPTVTGVDEVVVTGPKSPEVASLDDLSGKEIFVRKSSSYWEHLEGLNAKLKAAGKAPILLKPAPESLEDEDLMEMLNGGLVSYLVVDKPVAELWARILPNIKVRADLAVNTGGEFGWMIRKGSPQLAKALNAFLERHGEKDPARGEIIRKYLKSTKFVKNATTDAELKKFQATVEIFKKYCTKYSADYLLMMAQGYQESRLDQKVKSRVGAVGVMQVMPSTGKAMKVGDVAQLDPNINAGVKFLTLMRDEYFHDEGMDDLNRLLFSFAAYNAGPNRILRLRKLAAERGFNPNLWFNNVEVVVAEKVGMETVTYVGNIFKYYVAYELVTEVQEEREKAKQGVKQ
ncbi:MAG TPA: transporter substrate-binding domain-containing protein [Stellaceae bacterium]|nr:transporter substrate-binding domain-containing protein [Stellaceae bacterium]